MSQEIQSNLNQQENCFEKRFLLHMDILGSKKIIYSQPSEAIKIKEIITAFAKNNREYKREITKFKRRECDLIQISSINQIEDIQKLPINSEAAYVRINNLLFYAIKASNIISKIPITDESLDEFDHKLRLKSLSLNEPKILCLNDIHLIKTITNHSHDIGIDSISKVLPSISSYSDHITASTPYVDNPNGNIENILCLLINASLIHQEALQKGLLMRGSLTVGDLSHDGNAILGKALIDAVNIEENVAFYPRVIIHENVIKCIPKLMQPGFIIHRDHDGLFFVNYINDMRFSEVRNQTQKLIQSKLEENDIKGDMRKLAKWQWLANKYGMPLQSEYSDIMRLPDLSLPMV